MSELRLTKNRALLLYAIAAAGLLITPWIAAQLLSVWQDFNTQWVLLIINALYYLPFIALPCSVGLRGMKLRNSTVRVRDLWTPVLCAALGVYMVNDLSVVWAVPLEAIGLNVNTASPVPQNIYELLLAIVSQAVLPAVCEEFLMRGAVLTAFERIGTKRAVFLTAAMFALLHGSVLGLPGEFLMGVVIGTVTVASDSVWTGVAVHTWYNAMLEILVYQQKDLPAAEGSTILEQAGGVTGVLILAAEALILGGLMYTMLRRYVRDRKHETMHTVRPADGLLKRREVPAAVLCGIAIALLYVVNTAALL